MINPRVVKTLSTKMYQTIEVLAARSGMSESTVKNTLVKLNLRGELDKVTVKVDLYTADIKVYRLKESKI
jgi:DNA-binding Lrp family transcriptional regulator